PAPCRNRRRSRPGHAWASCSGLSIPPGFPALARGGRGHRAAQALIEFHKTVKIRRDFADYTRMHARAASAPTKESAMQRIHPFPAACWDSLFSQQERQAALRGLEQGQVLYFPSLAFPLSEAERRFLSPAILRRAKNVSYNPETNALAGA